MNDLISRKALIAEYDRVHIGPPGGARKLMEDAPAVDAVNNPYWENVCAIAERQREKGMAEYGQGIEKNPADVLTRIAYLQEELIDALMYCEWIKDRLAKHENRFLLKENGDIVPLDRILCKDCDHGSHVDTPEGRVWCEKMCRYMVYEGYCSYGKRRSNEQT